MSLRSRYSPRIAATIFLERYSLALAVIISAVVLFFIFNSIHEDGNAYGINKRQEKVSIIQSDQEVLRGTRQQCLVGIEVDASNLSTPFTISAIEFKITSNQSVISKHISNGILWYTGSAKTFDTYQQLGDTIKEINNFPFKIDVNKYLKKGKNYFWFAIDINNNAAPDTEIDVTCYGISIEGHYIMPKEIDPEGGIKILNNKPYFSQASGNGNDLSNWNSKRDGSGSSPNSLDQQNVSLILRKDHKILVQEELNTTYIVLENGAYLKSYNDINCKKLQIQSGGIFEQATPLTRPGEIGTIEVMNSATLIHNNTGQFPGSEHIMHPASEQYFFNYSDRTFVYCPTTWGNVEFRSEGNDTTDISAVFSIVQGDLVIKSSGPLTLSSEDSIRIFGDLRLLGGRILGNIEDKRTVWDIRGNFTMSDGYFSDCIEMKDSKSCGTLVLHGNLSISGGDLHFNHSASSSIVFPKNKLVTNWSQRSNETLLPDITIESGRAIRLIDSDVSGIDSGSVFALSSGASLFCSESQFTRRRNIPDGR